MTKPLVYRHNRITRITHWSNAIALMILLMSGLMIFNAHPHLYWGHTSEPERALLSIGAKESGGANYYESIDLINAVHPQTILAYEMNDRPLPVANGAPLRLRVENQLGYKHAKYIRALEFVASFDKIAAGKGGYWPDQGYEWYAGI